MPYTLGTDEVVKTEYAIQPSEGLGTTVIKTTWLMALIGVPVVVALYFGSKLRKAGVPLLPQKG